jgi:hypothetical protein
MFYQCSLKTNTILCGKPWKYKDLMDLIYAVSQESIKRKSLIHKNHIFLNSLRSLQKTYSVSITKATRLMLLLRGKIAIHQMNHKEQTTNRCRPNALKGKHISQQPLRFKTSKSLKRQNSCWREEVSQSCRERKWVSRAESSYCLAHQHLHASTPSLRHNLYTCLTTNDVE